MHRVENKEYGVKITWGGFIEAGEMALWAKEASAAVEHIAPGFGVFVDMRELKPLPAESQSGMQRVQALYKRKGMKRSVCILNNAVTTLQFSRIAKETGIYEWARYYDASALKNWEAEAVSWLKTGDNQDKKRT